jgi:hypothetical protein
MATVMHLVMANEPEFLTTSFEISVRFTPREALASRARNSGGPYQTG